MRAGPEVSLELRTAIIPSGSSAISTQLPLGLLAQQYVLGDNFFQASFGGSFAGSTLTLKANRRDLGGAGRVDFRIGSYHPIRIFPLYDVGRTSDSYRTNNSFSHVTVRHASYEVQRTRSFEICTLN